MHYLYFHFIVSSALSHTVNKYCVQTYKFVYILVYFFILYPSIAKS